MIFFTACGWMRVSCHTASTQLIMCDQLSRALDQIVQDPERFGRQQDAMPFLESTR